MWEQTDTLYQFGITQSSVDIQSKQFYFSTIWQIQTYNLTIYNLTLENLSTSECLTAKYIVDSCSCPVISWYISHQYDGHWNSPMGQLFHPTFRGSDGYWYPPRSPIWHLKMFPVNFPWIRRILISSQDQLLFPSDRETGVKSVGQQLPPTCSTLLSSRFLSQIYSSNVR